ncbi:uncharacterized protein LOC105168710 isoform X2 [Sesamum indicum]|uniref:Uncharacterized protein LOC105168710 isoform X2 n=1 Tax=Sesamum indicum TaxID=4182 RepID=A0A8M8V4U7_SESIN|nr:uncharacterized protein LOC105168710 isoform X2 [Sesamum indicum]
MSLPTWTLLVQYGNLPLTLFGSDCRNENQVLDSELRFRWRSKALISNGILVGNRDMNVFVEGLLSYPFLFCHFTVICTLWFTSARNRLPEEGQKWGFLVWLLFSYCLCALLISVSKRLVVVFSMFLNRPEDLVMVLFSLVAFSYFQVSSKPPCSP